MEKHYSSIISSGFGAFASKPFPKPIQKVINNSYVKLMKLDMSEFQEPKEYPTLNKLFTRSLQTPREISSDNKVIISPVDALVTDYGEITDGKAYQIKGMEYSISELFGEHHSESANFVDGGQFVNLYLSPKDYHRYHMPHRLRVESITHIAGKLYPVNLPLLRNKKDLFIENERVIIDCEDENGDTYVMVLVGALNVGKMIITDRKSVV